MTLNERIDALVALSDFLGQPSEALETAIERASVENAWFTKENIQKALDAIRTEFLDRTKLETWLQNYNLDAALQPKTIALIPAGNLPLVGFQDLLCVFAAGHRLQIKLSEKDKPLMEAVLGYLKAVSPDFSVETTERLSNFDAVIATGSNNTGRYFEAYFGKYPNLIRKNRNSVALLTGDETPEQLHFLGEDIFSYFGLGCRNVSKLYLPKGFDLQRLEAAFGAYEEVLNHNKYKNNFDYNYTLLLLNRVEHFKANCILMVESPDLVSRIAQLHYEFYDNWNNLEPIIESQWTKMQCIVSAKKFRNIDVVPFGQSQKPSLFDYADGVDVMRFLTNV